MRLESALRDASGYTNRPRDFGDLVHILDAELRLITPSDPEGSSGEVSRVPASASDDSTAPNPPFVEIVPLSAGSRGYSEWGLLHLRIAGGSPAPPTKGALEP